MMKKGKWQYALLIILLGVAHISAEACTNFLVTKGASVDGSTMISYAADSHSLYGELYYYEGKTFKPGSMLDIIEWDTQKPLGQIPQVQETYTVVGNMNEHQVAIAETTYGGRKELGSQSGAIMDYGSLIYVALQRAKSARHAIKIMGELVAKYGYASSGESFSIADKDEVWIMEMIGKGEGEKGAVWVARLIPDGYISGHANHARITTFPQDGNKSVTTSTTMDMILNKGISTIYQKDVISFARKKGWFDGKDADFSFSDVYAPLDFGGARFCEARVWSMFREVNNGMDKYEDYAMGHNLKNRMPLWVKPNKKISVKDMFSFMRNHFEGTKLDMTKDLGAGPYKVPYRWRPLTWEVEGESYCNERAVATQQTGFSFVTQSRNWLPDPIGGVNWFSVDDAGSTVYTPIYCGVAAVPETYEAGNGSMSEWSDNAAFWVFNQVSNLAYTRYSEIHPIIAELQKKYENKYVNQLNYSDKIALEIYDKDKKQAIEYITDFSTQNANTLVANWKKLYQFLFMKFVDGNIKTTKNRKFMDNGYGVVKLTQPGYDENYYKNVVKDAGEKLKMPKGNAH